MENCSSSMSIHQGNGTTHAERLNPALLPEFFPVDEKQPEDYILYVQKLAEYVKFYDENNIEDGSWAAFFESESTSVIITIAKLNIEVLQNNYRTAEKEIYLSTDPLNQLQILTAYFTDFTEKLIKISKKIDSLDNEIKAKENLAGSLSIVLNQLKNVTDEITLKGSETNFEIKIFLKNPFYTKKLQQFFGLLSSWKNYAESAVENQLNNYGSHHPHYALFISFLKLIDIAREHLNNYTKKHLDFYYKDVIRTDYQEAKPDSVYLTVEPQKTGSFLLPKNTIFPAGKNAAGDRKYYASVRDHIVNQIKLTHISSYYLEGDKFYKSENLIPKNGKGESFDVFRTDSEECLQEILIASPLLFLQSGERSIFLRFNKQNFKHDDFDFYITGEKKVIQLKDNFTEKKSNNSTESFIKLVISETEKSTVPFNLNNHAEINVSTVFPVLKIVPKNKNIITTVSEIDLEVSVEKFTSYNIESDSGTVDSKKPFYPFGEFPKNGNGITISSNEFFMKKNAVAKFVAETDRDSDASVWMNDKVKIYQQDDSGRKDYSDSFFSVTNHFDVKDFNFKKIGSSEKLRVELKNSAYSGEKYMEDYVAVSKIIVAGSAATLPYKPRIKDFSFSYSSKEIINLKSNSGSSTEVFISQPFGYRKVVNEVLKFQKLINLEGFICLGFENAVPKESLCFLIQLEEGTANPQLPPAEINWKFLSENKWGKFNENSLADETYALTQSGIIAVTVPEFNPKNTLHPENVFWIRISVSDIRAVCRILGVHHQAFKAVLTDFENKGNTFTEITPKGTVSKSYKVINGIKKIDQPYPSFGGRVKEENKTLYIRTSERLRHKNRAITSWDYEHILLQNFPEIYRVKTLNHYRYDSQLSNVSAGFVTIIPVAKSSATENINWKPLLSINKMQQIKEFLVKISSPHAVINVKPPIAERVELNFKVKFHKSAGTDSAIYKQELLKTINEFLSPWAFGFGEISFAQNVEFSSLIKLVDNQYYVDYITDFSVTQYILDENYNVKGNPIKNLNKVSPQTDFSLFIPTETHQIQEI